MDKNAFFRGAKLWNNLTVESKMASSLGGFKNEYRVENFLYYSNISCNCKQVFNNMISNIFSRILIV